MKKKLNYFTCFLTIFRCIGIFDRKNSRNFISEHKKSTTSVTCVEGPELLAGTSDHNTVCCRISCTAILISITPGTASAHTRRKPRKN